MEVIVLDGNLRPALAVTRSLGKRGIDVTVGAETNTFVGLLVPLLRAQFSLSVATNTT